MNAMRINLTVELSEDMMASIREAAVEGRYPSITVQARTFNPILAPPWKDDLLPPRWLTIQGARRYTGLSDTTLRKACSHGLIKSYFARTQGMGAGKRLLDRLSIDDWIESGTPGADRFRYEEPGKRKRQAEMRAMIKENKERWAKDPQK